MKDEEDRFEQLIIMDKALDSFSTRYPRQSSALKLKYLMGMKNQEISELLECSASLIEKTSSSHAAGCNQEWHTHKS